MYSTPWEFQNGEAYLRSVFLFGPCTPPQEIERGCQIIRECARALQHTCMLEQPLSSEIEAPEHLRDGILQFRSASSNSWIIANKETRSCIVIDPCDTVAERIEHYIRCQNLQILGFSTPILMGIIICQTSPPKNSRRSIPLQEISVDSLGWPTSTSSVHLKNGDTVKAICIQSRAQVI